MHREHAGVVMAAVDYEIVALAVQDERADVHPGAIGDFRDVHVRDDDRVFRYVAGYLSLEAPGRQDRLIVHSHGRATARLVCSRSGSISMVFEGSAIIEAGRIVLPDAGLGVIPRCPWRVEGSTLEFGAPAAPARFVLVHGPARSKVEARMVLADSLYAVGGRRG